MKLIKIFLILVVVTTISLSEEKININFKNLKIMDFIKITSKITNKNILVTNNIKGNVDFISNKAVEKRELIKILIYVLESKGFTLISNNDIFRIVKLSDSAKQNLPVLNTDKNTNYYQMVTEVFTVYNIGVDYISSKVRHLISKNAKLVTNKDTNSLMITDFKDNILTIKKVIKSMTSGAKKSIKIIELKNIKASEAKKSLTEVA